MSREMIQTDDNAFRPYSAKTYADLRGVVEYGNLQQFAPFEGGYSFLGVINGPKFMDECAKLKPWVGQLQDAFITSLEQEFKGLDGIEDITTETMDITDNISTLSLIGKTVQTTNGSFTVNMTEKQGGMITKYISTYLRFLKDPKTLATTYGGVITKQSGAFPRDFSMEVFNLLYVVTNSTMKDVEKAFLILNAQPTSAAYSELYNTTKGEIGVKDISVSFLGFCIDGSLANNIAQSYLDNINNAIEFNSYDHDYMYSVNGGTSTLSKLNVEVKTGSKLPVKRTHS